MDAGGFGGASFVNFLLVVVSVFNFVQFSELLVLHLINIVDVVAMISRFRAEEEHEDELDNGEDLEHVEEPVPAEGCRDLTGDDGGQTGRRIENEGDEGDAKTALMDKEHISNGGDDEGLVRTGGESLDNTRRKEHIIGGCHFSKSISDDGEEGGDEEDWSFTISTRKSAIEWSGTSA